MNTYRHRDGNITGGRPDCLTGARPRYDTSRLDGGIFPNSYYLLTVQRLIGLENRRFGRSKNGWIYMHQSSVDSSGERVTSYLSGPFSSSPGSIYGVQLVVGDGDDDIHHNHPVIIGQRASVAFLAV